jgi:hypothetical protein
MKGPVQLWVCLCAFGILAGCSGEDQQKAPVSGAVSPALLPKDFKFQGGPPTKDEYAGGLSRGVDFAQWLGTVTKDYREGDPVACNCVGEPDMNSVHEWDTCGGPTNPCPWETPSRENFERGIRALQAAFEARLAGKELEIVNANGQ